MRKLPDWASLGGETPRGVPVVDVDTDPAYEAMLRELGVDDPDQYWLEVAYQCLKMDLQVAAGFNIEIHMHDQGKSWAQAQYPEGRGAAVALANNGAEIRQHYLRLRGYLPQG